MRIKAITILFFVLAASVTGCGGNSGWPQREREKLIGSCVGKAKADAAGLDETKLTNYCSCYQQNLEKRFPDVNDLKKVNAGEVAKEAQKCLELMFK